MGLFLIMIVPWLPFWSLFDFFQAAHLPCASARTSEAALDHDVSLQVGVVSLWEWHHDRLCTLPLRWIECTLSFFVLVVFRFC